MSADGCGAPAGGVSAPPAAAGSQAIVEGRVTRDGAAVTTGYARLLGTGDEFVAEVPLGEDGGFRFENAVACEPAAGNREQASGDPGREGKTGLEVVVEVKGALEQKTRDEICEEQAYRSGDQP